MTLLIIELTATALLALLVAAFFAAAESVVVAVNRQSVRQRAERGEPAAQRAEALLEDAGALLHMTKAGHLIGLLLLALAVFHLVQLGAPAQPPAMQILLAAVIAVPLAMTLGLVVPKALGWRHASRALFALERPLSWLWSVLRPLETAVTALVTAVARLVGGARWVEGETLSKRQVLEYVQQQEAEGEIETDERQMIHRILNLHRTLTREVMRPLIRTVALVESELGRERLAEVARATGHSRFPVHRGRIIDLIGHIDIYEALAGPPKSPAEMRALVHAPHFVPETKRVDDLLQEMLRQRRRVAIVIDEHGACSGWVTREDILEEILGQISDEFDRERPWWTAGPNGEITLDAAVDLDDLNARFGLAIPKTHSDTLAGFLYERLGRVPCMGESVRHGDHVLRVAEMNAQQIVKVRLESVESVAG